VFSELERSHIVGEPQLQEAAQAAKVAIHTHKLAHVLVVHDAFHLIPLPHIAQVARNAGPGPLRVGHDLRFFVEKHRYPQVLEPPRRLPVFWLCHHQVPHQPQNRLGPSVFTGQVPPHQLQRRLQLGAASRLNGRPGPARVAGRCCCC
jgi:hypothetical protein